MVMILLIYVMNLHPNMYLLIPECTAAELDKLENLHPNMYLLIHPAVYTTSLDTLRFTSQHVSINSLACSSR